MLSRCMECDAILNDSSRYVFKNFGKDDPRSGNYHYPQCPTYFHKPYPPADRTTQTFWSSITPQSRMLSFGLFVQRMANRIQVGEVRYGAPKRRQRYMSRMQVEMQAYKKTGNMEHLLNIANYCWSESEAPENPKFHFDAQADSVTRDRFGI